MAKILKMSAVLAMGLFAACSYEDNPQQPSLDSMVTENSNAESDVEILSDEEALGLKAASRPCTIDMPVLTYTKAMGGDVSFSYSFLEFSRGDRIRITKLSDNSLVWGSQALPEGNSSIAYAPSGVQLQQTVVANATGGKSASGSATLPVANLAPGEYRVQGFINVIRDNRSGVVQLRDCGPGKKLIIRER